LGAKAEHGTIRIPPIRTEAAYAVALHEIGHIRCHHSDNLDVVGAEDLVREVLACERRAWEWAGDNALIWTPTMEREAEAGIASYEAHFAGATKDYLYKRVLELVNDLCLGDPVGPEIWYALIRNACELAQLYEEPKEVLIDLVDRQFAKPNPAFTARRSRRPRAVACPTKDRQGVLAF
jgi:hypothetical protein